MAEFQKLQNIMNKIVSRINQQSLKCATVWNPTSFKYKYLFNWLIIMQEKLNIYITYNNDKDGALSGIQIFKLTKQNYC